MEIDQFTQANRAAWDRAAPYHSKYTFEHLLEKFRERGFSLISPLKQQFFRHVGLQGKAVAQLACNNGRELICLKRLGARRCVGFDISDAFIEQARELDRAAGSACEFMAADAYAVPASFHAQFDIVYLSSGTLRWMPDLPQFFKAIGMLLAPGGRLVVLEMHPLLSTISTEALEAGSISFCRSYFARGPFQESQGLDYYGRERYDSPPAYWFHHPLGAVVNACNQAALALLALEELPYDLSGGAYGALERAQAGLPLSFSLVAQKPAS